MGLSVATFALAKNYTDETVAQFGGLKGAPCKIKSIIKENGQNIITLEWKNDEGETREEQMYVDDGTPIYTWEPNYQYKNGDLAIYQSCFYQCAIPNQDVAFDPLKWNSVGNANSNYDIIEHKADLPQNLTSADRKMYYCIDEESFYLWNGEDWVAQQPTKIELNDIDALFL